MYLVTFGPQGTFCHILAQELTLQENISLQPTIADVCRALSQTEGAYALLPIENSISGPVLESQRGIDEHNLEILAEYERDISYVIAGWAAPSEVKTLFAHPHAYRQAKEALAALCPYADVRLTPSNAQSALELIDHESDAAALVSPAIAERYALPSIGTIWFSKENRTRFALVKRT